jgi:hypothetical protein
MRSYKSNANFLYFTEPVGHCSLKIATANKAQQIPSLKVKSGLML